MCKHTAERMWSHASQATSTFGLKKPDLHHLPVWCNLPWCIEWEGLGLAWAGPASQVTLQSLVHGSGWDPGGCNHYQTVAGSSCWDAFPLKNTDESHYTDYLKLFRC